ncbi:MAG: ABC-type phosphate transport system, periplasmic component [Acidimicrobiales bacterium]|nr:ABC-type phosphate transport system, periplasmic component [Acidimicrobiales bacterium]
MKRFWKVAVAATAVLTPLTLASTASATSPTGYGFDLAPHVIVGGGSDTTYKAMVGLTDLYLGSPGCFTTTQVGPNLGKCITNNPNPETNTGGNYQHDTVAQATPAGSSSGIASLNGFIPSGQANTTYAGSVNSVPSYLGSSATGPNLDFARSSRGPKTTGGNAIGGNELAADTFWGYGQDGVEVMVFQGRSSIQSAGGSAITPTELYHIWNCDYANWSDIPSLGITVGSADDGPIVPWGLNSASGTFATFNSYIIANGGAPANWTVNGQTCDRKLVSDGTFPFENDIKPLINDVGAANLSTSATSTNNPKNWIWFGSYGELSSFPYKASYPLGGTTYSAVPAPVNGKLPSTSKILSNTYPIGRTLYHVTRKQDADCVKTGAGACDFVNQPGPAINGGTDLNVQGGTSGISGAVREFTRFICRSGSVAHATDPYTGNNYAGEITAAVNNAGFTVTPFALRASGSSCQVIS